MPNFTHGEVIEAVFRRTRVTVGLMTSAKLLSAVEPVIRYQRGRFRGAESIKEGSLRYELGIQQREDALQRLVDVWASGEASAALGFAAARLFDELDPLERQKSAADGRARHPGQPGGDEGSARERSAGRWSCWAEISSEERRAELEADTLVQFVLKDAAANVLCPATKLWNTGEGARMMREAVSLMGGYGITEDCPGYLAEQVDGRAAGGDLRRPGGSAAAAVDHHHDERSVPGAVPRLDQGDARDCLRAAGHGCLHPGHGDDHVAVDTELHAARQGR